MSRRSPRHNRTVAYIDPHVHPEEGREFAVRYYRWSLEQISNEVRNGLPTLRLFRGPLPDASLAAFERWKVWERKDVGRALVRRHHKDALGILGEQLTPLEEELANSQSQRESTLVKRYLMGGFASGNPRDPWHHTMSAKRPSEARRRLRKEVEGSVELVAGTDLYRFNPRRWRYRTPVGRWVVLTELYYFGRLYDLAYAHEIRFGKEAVSMCRFISALDWLGFSSAPESGWLLSSPEEIPPVAACLADLCRQFLEAAPSLLPE